MRDGINAIEFYNQFDICGDIGFINFNSYTTYSRLNANAEYLHKSAKMSSFLILNSLSIFPGTSLEKLCKMENIIHESGINYIYDTLDQKNDI